MSEMTIKEPKNITPVVEVKDLSTRERAEVERKAMRDKEREMVTGVFKNYECKGGLLEFSFKKYKEDQIEKFELYDGKVYTLPLGVARHINSNCWYPVHEFTVDENGKPLQAISQKIHRYGFSSLDFMDSNDVGYSNKQIVTVQNILR